MTQYKAEDYQEAALIIFSHYHPYQKWEQLGSQEKARCLCAARDVLEAQRAQIPETQSPVGSAELDEAIRLLGYTRNHQEERENCESCLNNLNKALQILRNYRAQPAITEPLHKCSECGKKDETTKC